MDIYGIITVHYSIYSSLNPFLNVFNLSPVLTVQHMHEDGGGLRVVGRARVVAGVLGRRPCHQQHGGVVVALHHQPALRRRGGG